MTALDFLRSAISPRSFRNKYYRDREKMVAKHTSQYRLDIPPLDLNTFIFASRTAEERSQPQYFDASRPKLNYSLSQAEALVKRVGKGLQNLGLGQNAKLLLYSGNSL